MSQPAQGDGQPPEVQGKPLSLRWASVIVLAVTGVVLVTVAEGVHDIHTGNKGGAFLSCLVAAFYFLTLPLWICLYLQLKKGTVIVLRPLPLSNLPQAPFVISVALTTFMTLMVAAAGILSYFVGFALPQSLTVRMVFVSVNAVFWLITAFLWYHLTSRIQGKKIEPGLKQTEGVWPPAPKPPTEEDAASH